MICSFDFFFFLSFKKKKRRPNTKKKERNANLLPQYKGYSHVSIYVIDLHMDIHYSRVAFASTIRTSSFHWIKREFTYYTVYLKRGKN